MPKDCIFCKIIKGLIPSKIIASNNQAIAFMDINPESNGHILIVPKKHSSNLPECDEHSYIGMQKLLKQVVKLLDKKLKPDGYNFISNCGSVAGQTVMHTHIHILPRYDSKNKFSKKISVEEVYKILS